MKITLFGSGSFNNVWRPPGEEYKDKCVMPTVKHDNVHKHTSKTTIALLKRMRIKVMDWPSMSPDLNPIEHLWGILKRKVEVCKGSNICQLRGVVMEEWKSIPVATCEALGNSMPRKVKSVLDNDSGHTKYWQLTWCMLILITFLKKCTQFCWQVVSFSWLHFELFWAENK